MINVYHSTIVATTFVVLYSIQIVDDLKREDTDNTVL